MGESAAAALADGDASDPTATNGSSEAGLINIVPDGDIILDVSFKTSEEVLRKARKAASAAARKTPSQAPSSAKDRPKPLSKAAYRVSLEVLKSKSKYFENLLGNTQFKEALTITKAFEALSVSGRTPKKADSGDLPRISIVDEDYATKAAGRESAFEDMLRLVHGRPLKPQSTPSLSYITTIAVTADLFDCTAAVSKTLSGEAKIRWPVQTKPGRSTDIEQVLRQKILVAWLLGHPMRMQTSTRELILRGSNYWSAFREDDRESTAAWCDLPDGLEYELQFRRECILNTIASVQRHFLKLYSSRERQCKLGYDSSAACDSFQLGQMLRFLVSRDLAALVDFGPASLDAIPDSPTLDVEELLATLKQCPNYQVDKFHTNCGLRIRVGPILDYIRAMLSAGSVSVSLHDWRDHRDEVSWAAAKAAADPDEGDTSFLFTRAIANDNRIRYEGQLFVNRAARALFTAETWNWTPEF
ncbi:hypothetical protein N3K66_002585 [Trichothecium roseum]|uniref:Uncharacterized protein n=1 Tax=Trichothecium roseum TaxID=47278 RepID=A0ACC0VCQ1_9HYPO|nr:hypothetical protein N3K66_002585 [Trichothecium roseum]